MKFIVTYGKEGKTKKIIAKDLEEAEKICDEKLKTWTDIIMVDKSKGKEEY